MITKTAVLLMKCAIDTTQSAPQGLLDSIKSMAYNALGTTYNTVQNIGGKARSYLQEGINGWKNVYNGITSQPGRAAVFEQTIWKPIDDTLGTTFSSARKALSDRIDPKRFRMQTIEEKATKFKKDYQKWQEDHWQDIATQEFRPGGKWVHGKYVPPDLLSSLGEIRNRVNSAVNRVGQGLTSAWNGVVNTVKGAPQMANRLGNHLMYGDTTVYRGAPQVTTQDVQSGMLQMRNNVGNLVAR